MQFFCIMCRLMRSLKIVQHDFWTSDPPVAFSWVVHQIKVFWTHLNGSEACVSRSTSLNFRFITAIDVVVSDPNVESGIKTLSLFSSKGVPTQNETIANQNCTLGLGFCCFLLSLTGFNCSYWFLLVFREI